MLIKGIYEAANRSGWSMLELADRLNIAPEDLEEVSLGVQQLELLSELTGYSVGNMRRMGLGLDPIDGNY